MTWGGPSERGRPVIAHGAGEMGRASPLDMSPHLDEETAALPPE